MKETLHLIALRTVRHNERHSILTAYTLERGMMSFLQPAGGGKEAARRRALLMPLGLAEVVADLVPGREIHPLGQTRALAPLQSLRSNPLKSSLAMFLAEVVLRVQLESQPDPHVWHFVEQSVVALDALPAAGIANFHVAFLVRLMALAGIEPDVATYRPGAFFDMVDGVFRTAAPSHTEWLDASSSALLPSLARITYINMHLFRLTRQQRSDLLDGLLRYYTLHGAALSTLHTLPILRTLF